MILLYNLCILGYKVLIRFIVGKKMQSVLEAFHITINHILQAYFIVIYLI